MGELRLIDVGPQKRRPGRPRKRVLVPGEEVARRKLEAGKNAQAASVTPIDDGRWPNDVRRVRNIFKFIHDHCHIPDGKLLGQKVKLEEWQLDAVRVIYGEPGTRRAIISIGRKNGKTTFAACLLLAHIVGPEARGKHNAQLYSAAQSRDQAALIFNIASKMIGLSPEMREAIRITESSKSLINVELGIKYRALSAEATTAFGLNPSLVLFDELGQVRGPRSPLFEALETAVGAQENPLTIIISTQAASDQDLLSILIDDAQGGHDPRTVLQLHTAPKELDPFAIETIRLANPSLDSFMSATEVLDMAAGARRMPARENEFRNLVLNQRCEISNPFISPELWAACNGDVGPLEGLELYGGLDLAEVADLTAFVLIGKADGKWRVLPTFWLPTEGLADKSVADRVPYDMWARQGYMQTTPGRSVSYKHVAEYLRQRFLKYPALRKIGFDRWHFQQFLPWLKEAGFGEQFIAEHFVEFGQGFQSMSPALRELEQIVRDRAMAHGDHPVLRMCVHNTIIVGDDAGNRKPSKRRSSGRIDGLVALAMAVGVSPKGGPKIDVEALIG